ncbi:MAG: hypothetical protein IKX15_01990 [Spirochaetales bacterium]|nr:hypothetical protein [Spirochaetales bacterium]MBR5668364.1 hypothetical protein [Spirochaetales bacterium]
MADKKVSFDFGVIITVLVGILLIFAGISGFDSKLGDDLVRPLVKFLDEEAFIYIVFGLAAISGVGIIVCQFVSGMPPVISKVCGIIALAFWGLIIFLRDIAQFDDRAFMLVIRDLALDLIVLAAILQSTFCGSKN